MIINYDVTWYLSSIVEILKLILENIKKTPYFLNFNNTSVSGKETLKLLKILEFVIVAKIFVQESPEIKGHTRRCGLPKGVIIMKHCSNELIRMI